MTVLKEAMKGKSPRTTNLGADLMDERARLITHHRRVSAAISSLQAGSEGAQDAQDARQKLMHRRGKWETPEI